MVNGKSVARLSIATSQSWKDKSSGEKRKLNGTELLVTRV